MKPAENGKMQACIAVKFACIISISRIQLNDTKNSGGRYSGKIYRKRGSLGSHLAVLNGDLHGIACLNSRSIFPGRKYIRLGFNFLSGLCLFLSFL